MRLLILFFVVILLNCKSSKDVSKNVNFAFFSTEKNVNNNFLLITKKTFVLKNHDGKEEEKAYSLIVPNYIKRIKSTVSKIPNENLLEFKSKQKVIIFGNDNNLKIEKYAISRNQFLVELEKGYFPEQIDDISLKKGRFFGIFTNDKYVLAYFNVKKENIPDFNKVLNSMKINKK